MRQHAGKIVGALILVASAIGLFGGVVVRSRPMNCDDTNAHACTVQKYGQVDPIECHRYRICNDTGFAPMLNVSD